LHDRVSGVTKRQVAAILDAGPLLRQYVKKPKP